MKSITIEEAWLKFAESIEGSTKLNAETSFNPENTFTIQADNAIIYLIWATQPERGLGPFVKQYSNFKFRLKSNSDLIFKVYPKDNATKLFTLFTNKRIKTGNSELDKSYLFISSRPHCMSQVIPEFINLKQTNKFIDFTISTEKEGDSRFLVIQINELIVEQNALKYFYDFGLLLSKKLHACA